MRFTDVRLYKFTTLLIIHNFTYAITVLQDFHRKFLLRNLVPPISRAKRVPACVVSISRSNLYRIVGRDNENETGRWQLESFYTSFELTIIRA